MEPTCDAIIRTTEKTGDHPLKIAGVDRVAARAFVDGKREVTGLPHSRVNELRELGYEVEVTKGDDPEALAAAAMKEAQDADAAAAREAKAAAEREKKASEREAAKVEQAEKEPTATSGKGKGK